MSSNNHLPIEKILPELKKALSGQAAVVLQAPPGAGKTTRVPLALLTEEWLGGKSIVMLEPRRLAASNAACYMASQIGEATGERVGYTIRYERKVSHRTRIEVVTEGILTRRLQKDPELSGVRLVIFDEFHERNLNSDLALALCRDAQLGLREDLKILVMSATLDGEPVSRLLGDAPLVTSQGRSYPVDIRYLPESPRGALSVYTSAAVLRSLGETEGDILVFLPGAGDIRRCKELLGNAPGNFQICPLYGNLPYVDQERAILPGSRRKIVLATNIAETSLTIEGVRVVIDSGYARQPGFDSGSGLSRLDRVRISRASADQRAGRAGRLSAGTCYRLWTKGEQGALLPFTPPEIRTADLTPLALDLARWGVQDAAELAWLDRPSAGALAAARELLRLLGALDGSGHITPKGKEMADFPAHPRLARVLTEARLAGVGSIGCDLVALLSERDIFRHNFQPEHRSSSDLLDRLEALKRWRKQKAVSVGTHPESLAAVERTASFWRRTVKAHPECQLPSVDTIGCLLAVAWPDRIGKERQPGSGRYLLSGGQGGRLSERSALKAEPCIVAVEMEGGKGAEGLIHQASGLNPERLEELFVEVLEWQSKVFWDERQERIVACEQRRLGSLVMAERRSEASAKEQAAALFDGIRLLGLEVLNWGQEARQLAARVRFMARTFPEEEWPDFSPQGLLRELEHWLAPFAGKLKSRTDLSRFDPLQALDACLHWPLKKRLEEEAPVRLDVPSGSRVRVDYDHEGAPVLAVKLQELFGLAETPRVACGRVPVMLHLLSPARRPIQVTQDLRSFWETVYPEVKKELKGRYPKHPWPDDPWKAKATRFVKTRK